MRKKNLWNCIIIMVFELPIVFMDQVSPTYGTTEYKTVIENSTGFHEDGCPNSDWVYYAADGTCIYVEDTLKKDWCDAQAACKTYADGIEANLIKINNFTKREFIESNLLVDLQGQPIWLGLNDRGNEDTFVWTDRTSFTDYVVITPLGGGTENLDCVNIISGVNNFYYEISCDTEFMYICEWSTAVNSSENELPEFTFCPSEIKIDNIELTDNALVYWDLPIATDYYHCPITVPYISLTNHSSGNYFKIGTTLIIFDASDLFGNKAYCSFNVTVQDVEIPWFTYCSPNIDVFNLPGDNGAIANWTLPTASDNSLIDPQIREVNNFSSGDFFLIGTTSIQYVATDLFFNDAYCIFTINVIDVETPNITYCPTDIEDANDPGSNGAIVTWIPPIAIDNDQTALQIIELNYSPGDFFLIGDTIVNYSANDSFSNTAHCSFNITILDNEAPNFTYCPPYFETFNDPGMNGAYVNWSLPTAIDNSQIAPQISEEQNYLKGFFFGLGETLLNYSATDSYNNTAYCNFTINVKDIELPNITYCPSDIVISNVPRSIGAFVNWTLPTAHDNSQLDVQIIEVNNFSSGDYFILGNTSLNYSVTDLSSNTAYCHFIITVIDTEVPNITYCPPDLETVNDPGASGASVNWTQPAATDNSQLDPQIAEEHSFSPGDYFIIGNTSVNYSVTDSSSNTAYCFFQINVKDIEAPNITFCPSDIITPNDPRSNGSFVTWNLPNVTDNSLISPQISEEHNYSPGFFFAIGNTSINYTATDLYSNKAYCYFNITVKDTEAPNVTYCPTDFEYPNDPGEGGAIVNWTNPTATDNSQEDPKISEEHTYAPGDFFILGNTSINYRITDPALNFAYCYFTLTVKDFEIPNITYCPEDFDSSNYPGSNGAFINWTQPMAVDNSQDGLEIIEQQNFSPGDFFYLGNTSIKYTVTDTSLNMAYCSFTINVKDVEPPNITYCPTDVNNFNIPREGGAYVMWSPPTATDNSQIDPEISEEHNYSSGDYFEIGKTSIKYLITDLSFNTAYCNFTITIQDNEAPNITHCPFDLEFSNDPGKNGAIFNWTQPIATDNSQVDPHIMEEQNYSSGDFIVLGSTLLNYTVSDSSSNKAYCSFIITVKDVEPPNITYCPLDFDYPNDPAENGAIVNWTQPKANDNSDFEPQIIEEHNYTLGDFFILGNTSFNYSVSDAAANTVYCSFIISVIDVEPPNITYCPTDLESLNDPGDSGSFVNWTRPRANDNSQLNPQIMEDNNYSPGEYFFIGNTTIKYIVTDASSNAAYCYFIVIVKDVEAPNITSCPLDIETVNEPGGSGAYINWTLPTATDNSLVELDIKEIHNLLPGDYFNIVNTTVVYSISDSFLNTAYCNFTITIKDIDAPSITYCPQNLVYFNDPGKNGASVTWILPNATDNSLLETFLVEVQNYSPGNFFVLGNTSVNYTVSDLFLNLAYCSFIITVKDAEAPNITYCSPDIETPNNPKGEGAFVNWTEPMANDNSQGDPQISEQGNYTPGDYFYIGNTNVNYSITDSSSNTAYCSFIITIKDIEPPNITYCSPNVETSNDPSKNGTFVSWIQPIATDNSQIAIQISEEQNYSPGDYFMIGNTSLNYSVTDSFNTAYCYFTIIVNDIEAPSISYCPLDFEYPNDPGRNGAHVNWTQPIATDNSQVDPHIIEEHNYISGDYFVIGNTSLNYSVADSACNTAYCLFTITVKDIESPNITYCPTDYKVSNEAGSNGTFVTWDLPIAVDNSQITPQIQEDSNHSPGDYILLGNTLLNYTITDSYFNLAFCYFTIIVIDNEPPVFTYCSPGLLIFNDAGGIGAYVTWSLPTAMDNSQIDPEISEEHGYSPGIYFLIGNTTIKYSATDSSSNTAYCSFTITVKDFQDLAENTLSNNQYTNISIKCEHNCELFYVNPEDVFVASAICTNCSQVELAYTWSVVYFNQSTPQKVSVVSETETNTGLNSNYISLKSSSLEPGMYYIINLKVYLSDIDYAVDQLVFITNTPPMGGNCSLLPMQGIYLDTKFEINCLGWVDSRATDGESNADDASGLTFTIYYRQRGYEEQHLLADQKGASISGLYIPNGIEEYGYWVDVIVKIKDEYGSASEYIVSNLTIYEADIGIENLTSVENSLIDDFLKENNTDGAISILAVFINFLNEESISNDLANEVSDDINSRIEAREIIASNILKVLEEVTSIDQLEEVVKIIASTSEVISEISKNTEEMLSIALEDSVAIFQEISGMTFEEKVQLSSDFVVSAGNILASKLSTSQPSDDWEDQNTVSERLLSVQDKIANILFEGISPGQEISFNSSSIQMKIKRMVKGDLAFPTYHVVGGIEVLLTGGEKTFGHNYDKHEIIDLKLLYLPNGTFLDESSHLLNGKSSEIVLYCGQEVINATNTSMKMPTEYSFIEGTDFSNVSDYQNPLINASYSYTFKIEVPIQEDTILKLFGCKLDDLIINVGNNITSSFMEEKISIEDAEMVISITLPAEYMTKSETYITLNSSEPINCKFDIITTYCSLWQFGLETYESDNCKSLEDSDRQTSHCLCTNVEDFVSSGITIYPPEAIDWAAVLEGLLNLKNNAAVFSVILIVFCLYLFSLYFIWKADKKDRERWKVTVLGGENQGISYYYRLLVYTGTHSNAGTMSRVSLILYGDNGRSQTIHLNNGSNQKEKPFLRGSVNQFLVGVPQSLGILNRIKVWHDNSGLLENKSWFLENIVVADLQRRERYHFLCERWLAVEKDDGNVTRLIHLASREEVNKVGLGHLASKKVYLKFTDGHLWVSLISRPRKDNFTRVQRVSCCLCLLFCTMMANCMWYHQSIEAGNDVIINIGQFKFSWKTIYIGLMSCLVVVPVNIVIVQLFKNSKVKPPSNKVHPTNTDLEMASTPTNQEMPASNLQKCDLVEEKPLFLLPYWCSYIAWCLVVLTSLVSAAITFSYSLQWGADESGNWLLSFFISFCEDVLLMQPLKILIYALILSLILRKSKNESSLLKDVYRDSASIDEHNGNQSTNKVMNMELKSIKEKREKEKKMSQILRNICIYCFYLILLWFIAYSAHDNNQILFHNAINSSIYKEDKMTELNGDFSTFYNWINETMIPLLYPIQQYNGELLNGEDTRLFSDFVTFRVGSPRLRHLRVKPGLCETASEIFNTIMKACIVDYSQKNEDIDQYDETWLPLNSSKSISSNYEAVWKYQMEEDLDGLDHLGSFHSYNGGGFIAEMGISTDEASSLVEYLEAQKWLDQYTRAIFVEFTLYNPNTDLFGFAQILVESPSIGNAFPSVSIYVLRLSEITGSFWVLTVIVELILLLFIVYYIILEIRHAWKLKFQYLLRFWHLIEILKIGVFIRAVVCYILKKQLSLTQLLDIYNADLQQFINLQKIIKYDEIFIQMFALVVFLSTLKLWHFLRFYKRMGLLFYTLKKSGLNLLNFCIILFLLLVAFGHFLNIISGSELFEYRSFTYSLLNLFIIILGKFKSFFSTTASNSIALSLAYISVISFGLLIHFLILNFFISTISLYFTLVKLNNDQMRNAYDILQYIKENIFSMMGFKIDQTKNGPHFEEQIYEEDQQMTIILKELIQEKLSRLESILDTIDANMDKITFLVSEYDHFDDEI